MAALFQMRSQARISSVGLSVRLVNEYNQAQICHRSVSYPWKRINKIPWNGLEGGFGFYNRESMHQDLGYRTPAEVFRGAEPVGP